MNMIEILATLGKMGYTKDDVAKMMPPPPPQPQPQPQVQPVDYLQQMMQLFSTPQTQVQPQSQPLTQQQVQTQVDNGIEAQLKALTQAVQLNNVNSMANARVLPTTADDVIASIINPPVNIPDNTIK